jgi:hypothetical protein
VWSNPQIQEFLNENEDPGLDVTLFELVKTFQQVLERAKARPVYQISKENVSVPDMILHLHTLLRAQPRGKPLYARALFESQRSRRAMICLFLAILELVKAQAGLNGQIKKLTEDDRKAIEAAQKDTAGVSEKMKVRFNYRALFSASRNVENVKKKISRSLYEALNKDGKVDVPMLSLLGSIKVDADGRASIDEAMLAKLATKGKEVETLLSKMPPACADRLEEGERGAVGGVS